MRSFSRIPAILTAWLAVSLAFVQSEEITGKVVGVHDGDSITVLAQGRKQLKVRLEGIDAPETGQAFSSRSRETLAALVHGKSVTVKATGKDRYGRTLGRVIVGGTDANLALVRAGLAWHFLKYSDDPELARAEAEARLAREGIWSDANPVPPWDYRAAEKATGQGDGRFWLNTGSGVRHNSTCPQFGKTSRGRICTADEGRPCGICGG